MRRENVIDKRVLELVLLDQKEELESKRAQHLCSRLEESLIDLNSTQAQVVIGVRRSGKSTLCFLALEHAQVKYAYVDFNDERLRGISSEQLNDILEILYKVYGDFNYLFLDEVQDIDGWHLFVNRLLRKNIHIVVTGSNAKLLSSELSTYLSGRSKEIYLYPFSFEEYCGMMQVDFQSKSTKAIGFRRAAFDEYIQQGGFPELIHIADNRSYVRDLTNNILHRDIENRYKISYKAAFEQMTHHLLNMVPCQVVTTELSELFHFKSEHTAKNYLNYLKQAFLLIGIQKYSVKSKLRVTQEKIYPVDIALMNNRENAFVGDNLGWRLETIVLCQLLRAAKREGWDVYYLNERSGECDFIVCNGNHVLQAVQVSYDISSEKTRKRELKGLVLAAQMTGCENLLLITDHFDEDVDLEGHHIRICSIVNWSI